MTSRRAIALPLVIWCLALLAGLVVLVAGAVNAWMDREAKSERSFRARQQALSGIALGLHPSIKSGDPLLRSGKPDTEGFSVKITDESGRINPNFWIAQNNRDIFLRLFAAWGADPSLQNAATDALTDWIDGDDFRSLAGAERQEYENVGRPGFPANRPLANTREMAAILGLDELLSQRENWRNALSVWYSGKINIQHAEADVLCPLVGVPPEQYAAFALLRAGADTITGTDDDLKFASVEEAAAVLRASGDQLAALQSFFSVGGNVRRIESTGFCFGSSYRIVVVAPAGGSGQVMSWEEQ